MRCEKSTSLACLHLLSRCNDFIEKWLRLTLIIINIPVDLPHHLLSSEDQIDQEIRDLFAALAIYWPREKVRHFKEVVQRLTGRIMRRSGLLVWITR